MKSSATDSSTKTSAKVTGMRLAVCTFPFFVAYLAIRAIPVEPCDFLHAQTYNSEGTLDYCGPGDSGFVDLTRRSWPLSLKLEALDELRQWERRSMVSMIRGQGPYHTIWSRTNV